MNRHRVSIVTAAALTLLVAGGGLLAGCPPKQTTTTPVESPAGPTLVPSPPPETGLPAEGPAPVGKTVTVYTAGEDKDGNFKLEPKQVAMSADTAKTPAAFALKTMLADPKSPLPKGTTLHSVKIAPDGVATVDFSKELRDNFPGGDQAEALLINSVLSTLGQFKSIQSVQFLVDGKKIDSLGGNQTLDEPLPVKPVGTAVGQAE